jgi:hypothetical protein
MQWILLPPAGEWVFLPTTFRATRRSREKANGKTITEEEPIPKLSGKILYYSFGQMEWGVFGLLNE